MYRKEKLTNGIKLVTHAMPARRSVALGIWINVGGRYESPRLKGAAHFLEHLLFKGSRKYSCRRIKESIEGVGGSLNGFTSEELTCYLVKLPAVYLEAAFDVLSDMVLQPLLRASDVQKEKTVILEEIKMYKDLPQSYVHELLDELLWPDQPLGMSIAGSLESVSRLGQDSLRAFSRRYYTAANIVVSAAGSLTHSRLASRIAKTFSSCGRAEENVFLQARQQQRKPCLKILAKDTEQTHLALGFHGFKRDHPLRHALSLLHIILGANMSSRLFNEIREKRGLAYEIGTQVKRFHDTGAFIVHAGIDNRKVGPTVSLIMKELGKLRRRCVSRDEFRRARDFYIGQLSLALEDTLDHMLWIGETTATLDKVYSLEDLIKEIRKTTIADVQEAGRQIFTEEAMSLALIGPLARSQKDIAARLHVSSG
ncbi:MAG TPA: pitrilysin family protein [Patescibacteria group bacterium]|nr:pitrilysin family protein [Patescibacteria group bacterium]